MKYLLILIVFLIPSVASAASIRMSTPIETLHVGDTARIDVSLQTDGDIVNALDGALSLPPTLVVREIRYQNSIVPLWVEAPLERVAGTLSFSAVLPGGYQNGSEEKSTDGNLFTLIVEAVKEGDTTISITPATAVYLNDGEGSKASLSRAPLALTVTPGERTSQATDPADVLAPEPFTIESVQGAWYGLPGRVLVFITNDKDSGVASYEMARAFIVPVFFSWHTVQSPTPLSPLDSFAFIRVRAVDAYGNATEATMLPGGALAIVPGALVVLIVAGLFIFQRRLRAMMQS